MSKGLGAGFLSGAAVGAVVLAVLSLYAPLPQDRIDAAPKLEVDTPASAVVPQQTGENAVPTTQTPPTSENAAVVINTDEATIIADPVVQPATPRTETADTTPPGTPTAPLVRSEAAPTQAVLAAPIAETSETVGSLTSTAQGPVAAPLARVDAAVQPSTDESTPKLSTASEETSARVQPSTLEAPTVVGEEQLAEDASGTPTASRLPTIGQGGAALETASASTPITAPVPQITNPVADPASAPVAGVVTNRLPSVTSTPPTDVAVAAPDVEGAPEPDAPEAATEALGALRQFASPVEEIEGKSLFSVVLIDSGSDGVPRADITSLAVPVTVAIDPSLPDAAQVMAEYRAAGVEVVAIVNDLPTASGPSDVAVAVAAYFDVLDQAVAVMDPLDARIQSNRSLLQPVLGAIQTTGHGLITYDRGLNTAQQAAKRVNIPAATVFRVLDADLEEAPKIKRYLDRAAFNAAQDGSVVVVGRSYPETVQALVEWALEKDASIAMVPVSAIMLTQDGS